MPLESLCPLIFDNLICSWRKWRYVCDHHAAHFCVCCHSSTARNFPTAAMQAHPRLSTARCVSMQAVRSRFRPHPNLLSDRSITAWARRCSNSYLPSVVYSSGRLCFGGYQFWLRMLLDGRLVIVRELECAQTVLIVNVEASFHVFHTKGCALDTAFPFTYSY